MDKRKNRKGECRIGAARCSPTLQIVLKSGFVAEQGVRMLVTHALSLAAHRSMDAFGALIKRTPRDGAITRCAMNSQFKGTDGAFYFRGCRSILWDFITGMAPRQCARNNHVRSIMGATGNTYIIKELLEGPFDINLSLSSV
jgi:hypothetical protein